MSDNLVTCNHCGSHLCYEIKINETQNAYSCVTCGFSATDLLKDGEYDVEGFEETFPELYKDLKFIDEDKKEWVMNNWSHLDQMTEQERAELIIESLNQIQFLVA
jgi:transcription elongation factor Elf1